MVDFLSLTRKGLTCSGFWAQRPYYIRLFGYSDAKGIKCRGFWKILVGFRHLIFDSPSIVEELRQQCHEIKSRCNPWVEPPKTPKLKLHLDPPKPTFLQGPYKSRIRAYNKNLRKRRFWWVKVNADKTIEATSRIGHRSETLNPKLLTLRVQRTQ